MDVAPEDVARPRRFTSRRMTRILLTLVLAFCAGDARCAEKKEGGPKLNVLFIIADHLRPDLGRSIRAERWRYTEWKNEKGGSAGVELCDEQSDPYEDINRASQPENSAVISELATQLHSGWRAALPGATTR
jgi:hypothetical protein